MTVQALYPMKTEGLIDYRLKGNPTREAKLLLDAMVLGLEEIAEDENYREYMRFDISRRCNNHDEIKPSVFRS